MTKKLPSFDRLVEMAKNDPEALERLRQEHVNALIDNSPETFKQRLRGIQFQLDAQRRTSQNPMESCIKASKMMHDSLANLRDYLKFHSVSEQKSPVANIVQRAEEEYSRSNIKSADILPFKQPA
jgi:spore coat polysaccharide biosynthesis protein SpsF (cytidylyltransferase family)